MFPISYEALLAAISVSIGLAAAIMVGYWWDKLWSWTQNVVKASPKIVCEFCLFCKSVVWRLSNILLGGAFGLYWAFYVQLTGKSLPMNVFWSFVVILFVFACFGAWREQFLIVESQKIRRPDFRFQARESAIQPRIITFPIPETGATARVDFNVCFRNLGTGVAWHPRMTLYFGWLDDLPNLARHGGVQARGDWARGEPFAHDFWISCPAIRIGTGNVATWGWPNRDVGIFAELESRANSELGEVIVKTQYLHWRSSSPQIFLAPSDALIEAMAPHIEALKNSLATQPSPTSGTEVQELPPA